MRDSYLAYLGNASHVEVKYPVFRNLCDYNEKENLSWNAEVSYFCWQ